MELRAKRAANSDEFAALLFCDRLEGEASMQLDETWGGIASAGRSEDAGWGSDCALNGAQGAAAGSRHNVSRVLEVRVLEEVEELCSELQLHDLGFKQKELFRLNIYENL